MGLAISPISLQKNIERLPSTKNSLVDISYERKKSAPLSDHSFHHITTPLMGIEVLFQLLIKQGIISAARSYAELQKEVRESGEAFSSVQKARSEVSQKAARESQITHRWNTSATVYSVLYSFCSVIGGISMWATGAAPAGGAILLAAGVIQMLNTGAEKSGAWILFAEWITNKDVVKTRTVVTSIQLGMGTTSLVLTGAAVVFGGFHALKDAVGKAQMFFSSITQMGMSTTYLGIGFSQSRHSTHMADIQEFDLQFTTLKGDQDERLQRVQDAIQNNETLFGDLSTILQMHHANAVRIHRTR